MGGWRRLRGGSFVFAVDHPDRLNRSGAGAWIGCPIQARLRWLALVLRRNEGRHVPIIDAKRVVFHRPCETLRCSLGMAGPSSIGLC